MATVISPRALARAGVNVHGLPLAGRVEAVGPCLFPEGRAGLVVRDPPRLPARPSGVIERVHDADGGVTADGTQRSGGANARRQWTSSSRTAGRYALRQISASSAGVSTSARMWAVSRSP